MLLDVVKGSQLQPKIQKNKWQSRSCFKEMYSPLVGVTTGVMMLDTAGSIGNSEINDWQSRRFFKNILTTCGCDHRCQGTWYSW